MKGELVSKTSLRHVAMTACATPLLLHFPSGSSAAVSSTPTLKFKGKLEICIGKKKTSQQQTATVSIPQRNYLHGSAFTVLLLHKSYTVIYGPVISSDVTGLFTYSNNMFLHLIFSLYFHIQLKGAACINGRGDVLCRNYICVCGCQCQCEELFRLVCMHILPEPRCKCSILLQSPMCLCVCN